MEITKNTILITGGTSGIGFELATQLLKLGNTVIVTGRDQHRLEDTQKTVAGSLCVSKRRKRFESNSSSLRCGHCQVPELNVLINNAGIMRTVNLLDAGLADISREMETDLTGPIRMVKQFLSHLTTQKTLRS